MSEQETGGLSSSDFPKTKSASLFPVWSYIGASAGITWCFGEAGFSSVIQWTGWLLISRSPSSHFSFFLFLEIMLSISHSLRLGGVLFLFFRISCGRASLKSPGDVYVILPRSSSPFLSLQFLLGILGTVHLQYLEPLLFFFRIYSYCYISPLQIFAKIFRTVTCSFLLILIFA